MSAYNFGVRGRNLTKLTGDVPRGSHDNVGTNFMAARTPTIWEGKHIENSARFRTTVDFDREYLQRGSRYQKSETHMIDHDPSHVE